METKKNLPPWFVRTQTKAVGLCYNYCKTDTNRNRIILLGIRFQKKSASRMKIFIKLADDWFVRTQTKAMIRLACLQQANNDGVRFGKEKP